MLHWLCWLYWLFFASLAFFRGGIGPLDPQVGGGYSCGMSVASTDLALVDRLLEPLSRCIRGRGEKELLRLRADAALQARIDELADRCDEGTLRPDERAEYETYVRFGNFVAVLQAKARLRRNESPAA